MLCKSEEQKAHIQTLQPFFSTVETRLVLEASDLGMDQVLGSRDWSKTSKGVLLSDGDDIVVDVEIALNTLEVGLQEERGGEEAVVVVERGVVEEGSNALLGAVERDGDVCRASGLIVGELDGGGCCVGSC